MRTLNYLLSKRSRSDIDLKLPIQLPPNDAEEKEVIPPSPSEPNAVNPVSKAGNPPPKGGNPLKAEKNEPKSSNESSKRSNENGSFPPKNSLKTSSGFRNVKPNSNGLSK
uniref:Uncharacterized protein n=1 Tax=Peromyscus maniculatus bairdii TaxID=230844 RepID=A0A8C8W6E1_PERMB